MTTFAELLNRTVRLWALTDDEIAAGIGVGLDTVRQWRTGEIVPAPRTEQAILHWVQKVNLEAMFHLNDPVADSVVDAVITTVAGRKSIELCDLVVALATVHTRSDVFAATHKALQSGVLTIDNEYQVQMGVVN